MIFKTDYKLESFILNTKWHNLPKEVQDRMRGCFIDLLGASAAMGHASNAYDIDDGHNIIRAHPLLVQYSVRHMKKTRFCLNF